MTNPTIRVKDKDYEVPPLTLGQLRNGLLAKLKEHDELFAKGHAIDMWILEGEVVVAAIRRLAPDLDANDIFDALDLSQLRTLWPILLGLSGFGQGEQTPAAK